MVRAPCCEKMGLKRGPWTPEEDGVLISYIQQFGHGNWRALPKQAGLLRCGKSCRLRWTNYLRPDIKRGNFTREEEDTIIKLHQMLGNRWSAIAARLPGRTDNEIKNVWHTHLKKRLKLNQTTTDTRQPRQPIQISKSQGNIAKGSKPKPKPEPSSNSEELLKTRKKLECPAYDPVSPQQSSSGFSNGTGSDSTCDKINIKEEEFIDSWDTMPQPDETLWSQLMPMELFSTLDEFSTVEIDSQVEFPQSYIPPNHSANTDESLEFWHDIFAKAGEISELPEF